jgi:hypothetical protein
MIWRNPSSWLRLLQSWPWCSFRIKCNRSKRFLDVYIPYEDTETAFALGIVDAAPAVRVVLPNPEIHYLLVAVLGQHHLSIFARTPELVGESLATHYTIVSSNRCRGFGNRKPMCLIGGALPRPRPS